MYFMSNQSVNTRCNECNIILSKCTDVIWPHSCWGHFSWAVCRRAARESQQRHRYVHSTYLWNLMCSMIHIQFLILHVLTWYSHYSYLCQNVFFKLQRKSIWFNCVILHYFMSTTNNSSLKIRRHNFWYIKIPQVSPF